MLMKHFTDPIWLPILYPPILSKFDLFLVYLSGYFEIAFGIMFLIPSKRKMAYVD